MHLGILSLPLNPGQVQQAETSQMHIVHSEWRYADVPVGGFAGSCSKGHLHDLQSANHPQDCSRQKSAT